MIGYDNEFKEKVRSENDIVDVVSQYLPLKRSGRNYWDPRRTFGIIRKI